MFVNYPHLPGNRRNPFSQGPSTRNQRIERLWRDVRKDVVMRFSGRSDRMEGDGLLNTDDALHIYALHFVYLPLLQMAINQSVASWNSHNLSSKNTRGHSPAKQWH